MLAALPPLSSGATQRIVGCFEFDETSRIADIANRMRPLSLSNAIRASPATSGSPHGQSLVLSRPGPRCGTARALAIVWRWRATKSTSTSPELGRCCSQLAPSITTCCVRRYAADQALTAMRNSAADNSLPMYHVRHRCGGVVGCLTSSHDTVGSICRRHLSITLGLLHWLSL